MLSCYISEQCLGGALMASLAVLATLKFVLEAGDLAVPRHDQQQLSAILGPCLVPLGLKLQCCEGCG
jgi:hypothetical protein